MNLLARRYEQLVELDEHIAFYTNELELLSRQDDACQRLQTIPGFAYQAVQSTGGRRDPSAV